MESEAYSSYGFSDVEQNIEQQKSEVELHMDLRKGAYDRYMDMLIKRAYECLSENEDMQTEDEEEVE